MSQRRAIVIDDNTANAAVLTQLLREHDVNTSQLTNIKDLEAFLAEAEAADVVFLDLEMPVLNGYEILEIIKAYEHFQQVPILAYTVHLNEINTARERGFDGFIGKPVDADNFSDILERIFRGESVWEWA